MSDEDKYDSKIFDNKILYSDIVKQRGKINNYFSDAIRKPRIWTDYPCSGNVLSFGSGNVDSANHQEIKLNYNNVISCDSDLSSGSDYKNLVEIDKKFDLIICEHVFEHIKIEEFIGGLAQKFYDICNDNSKFIITIPNVNNFGSFFSHFDHKNFSPPIDLAAIFCCVGFEVKEVYKWSKINHMINHNNFDDTENYLSIFLQKHYGLELDRYITMVFQKNG